MASDTKAAAAPGCPFTLEMLRNAQRDDLIRYASEFILDPDTANSYLTVSEKSTKVTYGTWQCYADRPERFDKHPEVFCRNSLNETHYWEVDWSVSPNESVYIGVAYNDIERKSDSTESMFGNNKSSWCFGQYATPDGRKHTLSAWHNGKVWECAFPCPGFSKVGVLLDWRGDTLSFYDASSGDVSSLIHLYTFSTKFTQPVYPCFWVGKNCNYVQLAGNF
ncbi:neoverrucotoxin subunit alpha-like [Enoplosus armatus]|uniref:neoverrucotoxin subunit alpha-like n=1 Tax=Enoplosus armatus TaxID=215367 RepID=UPI003992B893